ncbi:predicted protein [Histoplasma capsulatum var. duboisii H88]|uniref:Predicted protein n=1 Tax=Ajellomyces capsulatus (strain H88) TaxID=544711 RepID=F0UQF2_AJEC8|nr:predicted protein [Histoplasma capsulatum var. duboisii H88]
MAKVPADGMTTGLAELSRYDFYGIGWSLAKKTSQHRQQTFFDVYDGSLVLRSKKTKSWSNDHIFVFLFPLVDAFSPSDPRLPQGQTQRRRRWLISNLPRRSQPRIIQANFTTPVTSPDSANSPSKSIISDLFQHTTVLGSFGSSGLNSCLYSSHFHVQILQPLIIAATSRSVANHTDLRPSAPQTPSSQHNHYIAKRERHGDTRGTGRRRWILFLENISPSVIGDHDQTTIIG